MRKLTRVVLTFLSLAALGCGESPPDDHTATNHGNAATNATTGATSLTVDGWTVELAVVNPPLEAGAEVFRFTVTDAEGPVEPDSFEANAFMPAHGHGTMVPTVTASVGAGEYEATVTFSMPGDWEVRVDTDADRHFAFAVEVEP